MIHYTQMANNTILIVFMAEEMGALYKTGFVLKEHNNEIKLCTRKQ